MANAAQYWQSRDSTEEMIAKDYKSLTGLDAIVERVEGTNVIEIKSANHSLYIDKSELSDAGLIMAVVKREVEAYERS